MIGSDVVDVEVRGLSWSSEGKVMDLDVLRGGRTGLVGAMMLSLRACNNGQKMERKCGRYLTKETSRPKALRRKGKEDERAEQDQSASQCAAPLERVVGQSERKVGGIVKVL